MSGGVFALIGDVPPEAQSFACLKPLPTGNMRTSNRHECLAKTAGYSHFTGGYKYPLKGI